MPFLQKKIPVVEFITAIESACRGLPEDKTSELRAKVNSVLHKSSGQKHQQNLSKEEREALEDLRKDETIKILPADKGRCAVIRIQKTTLRNTKIC